MALGICKDCVNFVEAISNMPSNKVAGVMLEVSECCCGFGIQDLEGIAKCSHYKDKEESQQ